MDAPVLSAFNLVMGRCDQCGSVIAKQDFECYVCGQPVPGAKKRRLPGKKDRKPAPPVTSVSNVLLIISLAMTALSYFSSDRILLPVAAALAGCLFVARIISTVWPPNRRLAPGPVTVPRLNH